MIGLPIVGLATTEMATVVENGVSGFVSTDVGQADRRRCATCWPTSARRADWASRPVGVASERFSIERFAREWEDAFATVVGRASRGRILVAPEFGAMP